MNPTGHVQSNKFDAFYNVQTTSTEGRNLPDLQLDYLRKISESLVSLNVKVDERNKNFQEWKNQTATTNDSSNESIGTTFEQLKDILNQITVPTVTLHLQVLRRDRKDFWKKRL